MSMQRGDVVWINFEDLGNASMTKRRPALVLQNDVANRYANSTIVAAIRHDTGKRLPVHVALKAGVAGLTKDSLVDAGHIATVRMEDVGATLGKLPPSAMAAVEKAIKSSLALN